MTRAKQSNYTHLHVICLSQVPLKTKQGQVPLETKQGQVPLETKQGEGFGLLSRVLEHFEPPMISYGFMELLYVCIVWQLCVMSLHAITLFIFFFVSSFLWLHWQSWGVRVLILFFRDKKECNYTHLHALTRTYAGVVA